jgi:hypothetical protein
MRRTRTLAVLASLAIAVGGAGLAKADSSSMAASTSSVSTAPTFSGSGTVNCSVSPGTGTTATTFTATDSSTTTGGATITGHEFFWGDGTSSGGSTSTAVSQTHKYAANGTYTVEETITGTFAPDGHETNECGSPVTVGTTPPPPCTVEATENGEGCPPAPCEVNADHLTGDGNADADDKTMADGGTCPNPVDKCKVEATEDGTGCPAVPCAIDKTHPNGDATGGAAKDKDDKTLAQGGFCPNPDDENFTGGTFYAAESGPLNVVVDASAVNLPSTSNSGAGEPLAGAKSTDTNCNNPNNACLAVKNLDTLKEITDYKWDFEAWHDAGGSVVSVEKATVDSGLSPSASHQFTKASGDDIVVVTLTITEDGETVVFHGIKPGSPAVDGELNSPNVILEPCNQPALIIPGGPSVGDLLVDSGVPLTDPDANGPLSGAITSNLAATPLGGVGWEVGCLVNTLGL